MNQLIGYGFSGGEAAVTKPYHTHTLCPHRVN
jgi:hypothetical protein